jgi:hypothetical protein
LEGLEDRCIPATVRWVGDPGLWSNAGNWLDDQLVHRLPGPGDDVLITPSGITITYDTVASVRSLIAITPVGPHNTIQFTGGELDVTGTAEFDSDSTLAISGGLLNAQGGLAFNHGVLDFSGGAFGSNPVLNAATLNLLSSTPATFILQNATTINGDLAAGQTVWVRGSNELGHTTVTWASGLHNAGTVRLESIDDTWQSALTISGGTLTNMPGGSIQVNAGSGGNRVLTGNITNLGTMSVAAGVVLRADGSTFTQAGGQVTADGLFYLDNGVFNFTGGSLAGSVAVLRSTLSVATTVTTPSTVTAFGPSTLTSNLSTVVTVWVQGNNRFGQAILATSGPATNAGTILLQSIDDTWRSTLTVSTGTLTNAASGTIQVSAGSGGYRVLNGNVTNLGTVAVGAGTFLDAQSPMFDQAGGQVTADGFFVLDRGTLNFTGGSLAGNVAAYASTLNVSATVTASSTVIATGPNTLVGNLSQAVTVWVQGNNRFGNATLSTAGTTTNAGTILLQSADDTWQSNLNVSSGTLTNAVGGVIQVNAGSGGGRILTGDLTNAGTLNVGAGTTFDLDGSLTNFSGGTLTGGTYYLAGTFRSRDADLTANAATVVLDGPGAGIVTWFGAYALANLAANSGSFTLQNGRSLTTAVGFANAGAMTVGAGSTFTTAGAYTQTAGVTTLSGGTLAANGLVDIQGGVLSGSGTMNASVRNNGAVNPGGTGAAGLLSITGDYAQTANGVLNIEIGGANPGSDFDQLAVIGVASLDGTLYVSLLNGFAPDSGVTFQILTFASVGGMFATVNADLSLLAPNYDPTDVTVQAA